MIKTVPIIPQEQIKAIMIIKKVLNAFVIDFGKINVL